MGKPQGGFTPSRRQIIRSVAAFALAAPVVLRSGAAFAAYPDRPVRLVVANSPGGPSDIIARIIAAALQESMGASFIVENKAGGGGNIGMGQVARADADGYTLLLATSAYSVNPGLYNALPYDPFIDFVGVAELATSPNVFAVKPDLGVSTMKEFVALAKKSPDKFNVSTPPIGTTPQLEAEVFKVREGLEKMATVVFGGGGDALKAMMSGTVQLSSGVLAPAHAHIKAGTIKALAVTGPKRWPDLPDVPTMIEAGYPDFVFETYCSIMAPAKTPADVVARVEKASLDALKKPDMRDRLTKAGFEVTALDGKGHMERVKKEVPMFKDIIEKAGIKKL